jgi:hypothetical protein
MEKEQTKNQTVTHNEDLKEVLSSENWKENCQRAAEIIMNTPTIKRLKKDYLIECKEAGSGLAFSISLIYRNTNANTLLLLSSINGQVNVDEALDVVVKAFEEGIFMEKERLTRVFIES